MAESWRALLEKWPPPRGKSNRNDGEREGEHLYLETSKFSVSFARSSYSTRSGIPEIATAFELSTTRPARALALRIHSATKSRRARRGEQRFRQAKDFQERCGANVKTNDSGCKAESRKARSKGLGYKGGCNHPDDDNFFLFPSLSRLARSTEASDFYFFSWLSCVPGVFLLFFFLPSRGSRFFPYLSLRGHRARIFLGRVDVVSVYRGIFSLSPITAEF